MDKVTIEDFWSCDDMTEALEELHQVEEAEKATTVTNWVQRYEKTYCTDIDLD